jgi:hypothetical protein
MHRFGGVAILPLSVFAHIDEHSFGILFQAFASLVNGDFFHPALRVVHQLQELRCVIHAVILDFNGMLSSELTA